MAKSKQNYAAKRASSFAKNKNSEPASVAISEKGIKTGAQFANLMSAMMGDIISGRVTPAVGNAVCSAGGKLLKVVEMQYKYGTQNGNQGNRTITLAAE